MMTYKQKAYIEALLQQKEAEMTPNLEYYIQTNEKMVTKDEASALIEELLEAPDKAQKENNEAAKAIRGKYKSVVNALNNKKKASFGGDLRRAGVEFTYSRQYLYFLTDEGKVELEDAPTEQVELFYEVAKSHVRGLK